MKRLLTWLVLPPFLALLEGAAAASGGGGLVEVNAVGGLADVDGYSLHVAPSTDLPDPLRDKALALRGTGTLMGAELRVTVVGSDFPEGSFGITRGGLAMAFYGVDHVKLEHLPLPGGLTIDPAKLWGGRGELFVGKQFALGKRRSLTPAALYPYVDLRVFFSFLQTSLSLRHPELGMLGSTAFNAYSFGIGPRVGAEVSLSKSVFLDFGVTGSVLGFERVGAYAGIGYWDR